MDLVTSRGIPGWVAQQVESVFKRLPARQGEARVVPQRALGHRGPTRRRHRSARLGRRFRSDAVAGRSHPETGPRGRRHQTCGPRTPRDSIGSGAPHVVDDRPFGRFRLVVLFVFGRRNERSVRQDWELLLTPKGERFYRSIEGRVRPSSSSPTSPTTRPSPSASWGRWRRRQLLDAGFRVIEQFAPSMLKLLSSMATFSRMVSAMAPISP